MHRFFVQPETPERIVGEEFEHLRRVLRLRPGEPVELLDGCGRRYVALLDAVNAGDALCRELQPLPSREPKTHITLYQGLPKADKLERILKDLSQLGVSQFVPVLSRYAVPKPGKWNGERLSKIAQDSCKVAGRAFLPEIQEPVTFGEALKGMRTHARILMPYEEGGAPLGQCMGTEDSDIALFIGPEGGIAPEEAAEICGAGGTAVTLGPRILRTELAPVAAVSAILLLAGDMN